MAEIDVFEKVNGRDNSKRPFITLRDRSITFSKLAIEALSYAEYIDMYIDRKGKRAAFKACKWYADALPFYRPPKEGRPMLVRISDKKKAEMLQTLAGIGDCGKGIRFYGYYNEAEALLIIDLKDSETT